MRIKSIITIFHKFITESVYTVATSPVVLRWLCDSPRTGCTWRITPLCMWREQAIIEWSRRVISIVACCHGAKLCAHAARDVRSQQSSTWEKSPPMERFYALLGRFCDLRDLGGDFSFQGCDFCSLSKLIFKLITKKIIFVTLESKQMMHFRLHGSW